ncbi:sigma-70 family RNA polymerase sigma factor [Dermatophilaceae bacterium Sec6.4]
MSDLLDVPAVTADRGLFPFAPFAPDEREIRTHRLLELAAACTDERGAATLRNTAIETNYDFARGIARTYDRRGIELEDLQQVALLALVLAVRRFDPDAGRSFTGYAVPTISGEIKRYFRDHGWMVRPPRALRETYREIQHALAELEQLGVHTPRLTDLASRLNVPQTSVQSALAIQGCFTLTSLDAPVHGRPGTTVGDVLSPIVPDETDRLIWTIAVHQLVAGLGEREREILRLRYESDLSQREIAGHLGISQMQVSRLLGATLTMLRSTLTRELEDVAS